MRKIELKTWPEYFRMISSGEKNFEVRKNDHDFKKGDVLVLREWNPISGDYTGRRIIKEVSYVLPGGNFGIDREHCMISLTERENK